VRKHHAGVHFPENYGLVAFTLHISFDAGRREHLRGWKVTFYDVYSTSASQFRAAVANGEGAANVSYDHGSNRKSI